MFKKYINVFKLLTKCINFAAVKHKNQRRKDKEQTPYINHPIGVGYILTNEAGITDPVVIQAAFLHDTVEDTNTTFEELKETFGNDVADVVAEVTDDKTLDKMERKRLQIENVKSSSPHAKLVKLADKLYNLRDLDQTIPVGWTPERAREYFEWAEKVVAGLRGTNQPMEDALDKLFEKWDIPISG